MVPGRESAGLVSPSIFRAVLTTSWPCHTCTDTIKKTVHKVLSRKQCVANQKFKRRISPLPQLVLSSCSAPVPQRKAFCSDQSSVSSEAPQAPETHTRSTKWFFHLADRLVWNRYNTCISLRATSLNPFFSKRRRISPSSLRWTPSGFTAMKVRSFTPVQPRGKHKIRQENSANYHLSEIKQVQSFQNKLKQSCKLHCH